MGSADNFCLRWNDFESNISSSFRELRQTSEFFDVTLCCDNGSDTVQAHKVILAACSPLFRRILAHNTHQNPFLYLKGIHQRELQNVLNFMYHGEVNVAQDSLNKFLAVAEELAVKGLTTNDNVDSRIPSTYYDHDNDDDDVEQPALQSKQRMSSVKKQVKRQNVSSTPLMASAKRKGDIQGGDSSLEVDIKRIKADPDAGSGGGADDNGDLFEGGADGEDYEGLGQFDDDGADFDDSVAGGSGAGTSGGDNKVAIAQYIPSKRGGVLLVDEMDYTYSKHRVVPREGCMAWRCTERAVCQVIAKTGPNGELLQQPVHNHPPREKLQ